MKLNKRSGLYTASNVTYDPSNYTAYSYSWWKFVKPIEGKIVFNNYNYSATTLKHQYKVKALLSMLAVNVDIEIEAPQGLDNLESSILYYRRRILALEQEIEKPRSHAAKNAKRRAAIGLIKGKIEVINQWLKKGYK